MSGRVASNRDFPSWEGLGWVEKIRYEVNHNWHKKR